MSEHSTEIADLAVSVHPWVQTLIYFPGDGTPLFLPDDTTREMLHDWLPHEISRIVLAARLRALADMLTTPPTSDAES